MTIDQARQMRTLVGDAIDDKTILPGVPERYLVQLVGSLSRSIDASVRNAGSPELRAALSNANRYYAQNIDGFSRVGVREAYREPTQSGYVEDNQLVARLLSGRGKPGVVREMRETMGPNSPEWAATRRNAMEQIIDAGRNQTLYGRRVVDMNGLTGRLNSLDDETVKELFGVADGLDERDRRLGHDAIAGRWCGRKAARGQDLDGLDRMGELDEPGIVHWLIQVAVQRQAHNAGAVTVMTLMVV
nr:hypothetical protein [Ancylobacter amanitiformis]